MNTELIIKSWKLDTVGGKQEITGTYAVMLAGKEIASQTFNGDFCGTKIAFPREVLDNAKELSGLISDSIQDSFK